MKVSLCTGDIGGVQDILPQLLVPDGIQQQTERSRKVLIISNTHDIAHALSLAFLCT